LQSPQSPSLPSPSPPWPPSAGPSSDSPLAFAVWNIVNAPVFTEAPPNSRTRTVSSFVSAFLLQSKSHQQLSSRTPDFQIK
jgi:hypothetical protein